MAAVDGDGAANPPAPSSTSSKYARPEHERRFLLRQFPPGRPVRRVFITDRYLTGTRLRLRRMVEDVGEPPRVVYKLTQKIRGPCGGPELITTVYLDHHEHAALAAVPAAVLNKTRYSVPPFGVDVFEPPLAGLLLAEVEFDSAEALGAFQPPPWAHTEVTLDSRFTGGHLAAATLANVSSALADLGHPILSL